MSINSFTPLSEDPNIVFDKDGLTWNNSGTKINVPILPTEEGLGTGVLLKNLMDLRHKIKILGPDTKTHKDLFCYGPGFAYLESKVNGAFRDYRLTSLTQADDTELIDSLGINTDTIRFLEYLFTITRWNKEYKMDLHKALKNFYEIDPNPNFIQFQLRYIKDDNLYSIADTIANESGTSMIFDKGSHKVQVCIYTYKGKRYIKAIKDQCITEIAITTLNYIFSSPIYIDEDALVMGDTLTLVAMDNSEIIML